MADRGEYTLGLLSTVAVSQRLDLVAETTRQALSALGWLEAVGVVEIDPDISDTAATQAAFGLNPDNLANCVVVAGKREGVERIAACMVLADTRADVNSAVKGWMDVRKASFLPRERAVEMTAMEYGGMNPIGLPAEWPVLIDSAVAESDLLVIGSGIRRSKLLLPGSWLARLPSAHVIAGLAS